MKTDFKTYPRKIHAYFKGPIKGRTGHDGQTWFYAGSSHAYRTCRDAVEGFSKANPGMTFKANFAKD